MWALNSCTVITTGANDLIAPLHDRMPVILAPEDWPKWLGEEPASEDELKALLRPFDQQRMHLWPEIKRVGNVKNNEAELAVPVALRRDGGQGRRRLNLDGADGSLFPAAHQPLHLRR